MKKIAVIFIITAAHLALCKIVVSTTRYLMNAETYSTSVVKGITQLLVIATKLLYFPILSLSLYSRHFFPGNLIYIVAFANSLVWAVTIYISFRIYKKIK